VRLRLEGSDTGHHERLIQRPGGWQRSPVKGSGSFSRRVVGWSMSAGMMAQLFADASLMAV
jgi:hypothetical protein